MQCRCPDGCCGHKLPSPAKTIEGDVSVKSWAEGFMEVSINRKNFGFVINDLCPWIINMGSRRLRITVEEI